MNKGPAIFTIVIGFWAILQGFLVYARVADLDPQQTEWGLVFMPSYFLGPILFTLAMVWAAANENMLSEMEWCLFTGGTVVCIGMVLATSITIPVRLSSEDRAANVWNNGPYNWDFEVNEEGPSGCCFPFFHNSTTMHFFNMDDNRPTTIQYNATGGRYRIKILEPDNPNQGMNIKQVVVRQSAVPRTFSSSTANTYEFNFGNNGGRENTVDVCLSEGTWLIGIYLKVLYGTKMTVTITKTSDGCAGNSPGVSQDGELVQSNFDLRPRLMATKRVPLLTASFVYIKVKGSVSPLEVFLGYNNSPRTNQYVAKYGRLYDDVTVFAKCLPAGDWVFGMYTASTTKTQRVDMEQRMTSGCDPIHTVAFTQDGGGTFKVDTGDAWLNRPIVSVEQGASTVLQMADVLGSLPLSVSSSSSNLSEPLINATVNGRLPAFANDALVFETNEYSEASYWYGSTARNNVGNRVEVVDVKGTMTRLLGPSSQPVYITMQKDEQRRFYWDNTGAAKSIKLSVFRSQGANEGAELYVGRGRIPSVGDFDLLDARPPFEYKRCAVPGRLYVMVRALEAGDFGVLLEETGTLCGETSVPTSLARCTECSLRDADEAITIEGMLLPLLLGLYYVIMATQLYPTIVMSPFSPGQMNGMVRTGKMVAKVTMILLLLALQMVLITTYWSDPSTMTPTTLCLPFMCFLAFLFVFVVLHDTQWKVWITPSLGQNSPLVSIWPGLLLLQVFGWAFVLQAVNNDTAANMVLTVCMFFVAAVILAFVSVSKDELNYVGALTLFMDHHFFGVLGPYSRSERIAPHDEGDRRNWFQRVIGRAARAGRSVVRVGQSAQNQPSQGQGATTAGASDELHFRDAYGRAWPTAVVETRNGNNNTRPDAVVSATKRRQMISVVSMFNVVAINVLIQFALVYLKLAGPMRTVLWSEVLVPTILLIVNTMWFFPLLLLRLAQLTNYPVMHTRQAIDSDDGATYALLIFGLLLLNGSLAAVVGVFAEGMDGIVAYSAGDMAVPIVIYASIGLLCSGVAANAWGSEEVTRTALWFAGKFAAGFVLVLIWALLLMLRLYGDFGGSFFAVFAPLFLLVVLLQSRTLKYLRRIVLLKFHQQVLVAVVVLVEYPAPYVVMSLLCLFADTARTPEGQAYLGAFLVVSMAVLFFGIAVTLYMQYFFEEMPFKLMLTEAELETVRRAEQEVAEAAAAAGGSGVGAAHEMEVLEEQEEDDATTADGSSLLANQERQGPRITPLDQLPHDPQSDDMFVYMKEQMRAAEAASSSSSSSSGSGSSGGGSNETRATSPLGEPTSIDVRLWGVDSMASEGSSSSTGGDGGAGNLAMSSSEVSFDLESELRQRLDAGGASTDSLLGGEEKRRLLEGSQVREAYFGDMSGVIDEAAGNEVAYVQQAVQRLNDDYLAGEVALSNSEFRVIVDLMVGSLAPGQRETLRALREYLDDVDDFLRSLG